MRDVYKRQDVKFGLDHLTAIYNALTVDYEVGGERKSLTLEVAVQLRCV